MKLELKMIFIENLFKFLHRNKKTEMKEKIYLQYFIKINLARLFYFS
jgi:hypothetical protein